MTPNVILERGSKISQNHSLNDSEVDCFSEFFSNHVVEGDGVDDAEVLQVILVGHVVAVPGHNVEGRVVLVGHEQVTLIL